MFNELYRAVVIGWTLVPALVRTLILLLLTGGKILLFILGTIFGGLTLYTSTGQVQDSEVYTGAWECQFTGRETF